jgi:hypothetical protein
VRFRLATATTYARLAANLPLEKRAAFASILGENLPLLPDSLAPFPLRSRSPSEGASIDEKAHCPKAAGAIAKVAI